MRLNHQGKTFRTDVTFEVNAWSVRLVLGKLDILWLRGNR